MGPAPLPYNHLPSNHPKKRKMLLLLLLLACGSPVGQHPEDQSSMSLCE